MFTKKYYKVISLCVTGLVLLFLMLDRSLPTPPPFGGELLINIVNNDNNITITVDVDAQGTVWGSIDDDYPVTHAFDHADKTANGTDWFFRLDHVDDASPQNPTFGYGLYKVSVSNSQFGPDVVFVDYRDCDYQDGTNNSGGTGYLNPDVVIEYDVSTGKLFRIIQVGGGGKPEIALGSTFGVWDHGHKDLANHPVDPSCFPTPPAAPQNLVLVNAGEFGASPQLSWDANTEPDLAGYHVWRGWHQPISN